MPVSSPYAATSAENEARIDFVRGASSLDTDKPAPGPNSRRDYVARRFQLYDGPSYSNGQVDSTYVELGAISRLPLGLQVAFRVKMLTIFALQLLLVAALVGACAYVPQVTDQLKARFKGQIEYLVGASVGVVGLLVLLYFIRALFPLNWLVLLLFSVAQALLFAILGIKFDTNLGFFNCGATLSCVLIMLLLSGVRRRAPTQEIKLLSTITAGLIAYVVVALASCVLFVKYGREFITAEGFSASLAFQFVLVMWFAIDAEFMYCVMSPDEYMHGVLYFYTDMILVVIMAVVAVAVAVGAAALLTLCFGSDGACDSCDACDCCAACGSSPCDVCTSSAGGGHGAGTSHSCASTCTWTDCCLWLRLCMECAFNLVNCFECTLDLVTCCFDCNWLECCECRRNTKQQQQQQPRRNRQGEHVPDSELNIPPWDELHKEPGVANESVRDLEMQRV